MSSNTLTFDQTPPRRPTIDDVGGGGKLNAATPPDPVTMLTAEDVNQLGKLAAAFGRVVPLARISVAFSAGTPSIASVASVCSSVNAATFTLTDNAAGDTTISWLATAMPTTSGAPSVSQSDDAEIDRLRAFSTTFSGNPAVQVKSKLAAVGTDCNFVVEVY